MNSANKHLVDPDGYLKTVKDNGFVIEKDENVAYDKSSTHQKEETKQEIRVNQEKKEELNKLTSVTYDSMETPGAGNMEKQTTR